MYDKRFNFPLGPFQYEMENANNDHFYRVLMRYITLLFSQYLDFDCGLIFQTELSILMTDPLSKTFVLFRILDDG
jgi:hypothetical protein